MTVLGLALREHGAVGTSSSGNKVMVPWRTSSWVMPSTYPSPIGSTGWVTQRCKVLFDSPVASARLRRDQCVLPLGFLVSAVLISLTISSSTIRMGD